MVADRKDVKNGKLNKGSMIIFDEAGVSISSRNWFQDVQKDIMFILQSFRHYNIGVIFTTPDRSFVDSQARKLFHDYLEVLKIDFEDNHVIIKPFQLQKNAYKGEVYTKYPWYHGIKMTRMLVPKPSKIFI